jgi:cell division septation protein DedD
MITDNNEKEDVIQDITEEGSSAKLRKYLILGGGVFIIFVIGIVISKFLFEPERPVKSRVVLPSEIEKKKVVTKEHEAKKDKKEDNSKLFNDIPVETPKVEKRENDKVVEENNFPTKDSLIAEEAKKKKEEQQVSENKKVEKPKDKTEEKEIQIVTTENRKVEPPKKQKSKKSASTMVKPKEVKIEKRVKEEPKRIEKKKIATQSSDKNYYIQVAAFTKKKPALKFLKKIEGYGFKYKIVEVKKGDLTIKRVLIGPYSRKEAKQHLLEVKEKINLKSFIKRVK